MKRSLSLQLLSLGVASLLMAGCSRDATGVRVPGAIVSAGKYPERDSEYLEKRGVPDPEYFEVCNGAPFSSAVQLATEPLITVDVRVIGAVPYPPFSVTLVRGDCRNIWVNGGTAADVVVVTQRPVAFHPTVFVREIFRRSNYIVQAPALGNLAAARVAGREGGLVYFGYAALPKGHAPPGPSPRFADVEPGWFEVCNGDLSLPGPPAWPGITVDVTIAGTSPPLHFAVTLAAKGCRDVWFNDDAVPDIITVTQRPLFGYSTGYVRSLALNGTNTTQPPEAGTRVSGPVSLGTGTLVRFDNR